MKILPHSAHCTFYDTLYQKFLTPWDFQKLILGINYLTIAPSIFSIFLLEFCQHELVNCQASLKSMDSIEFNENGIQYNFLKFSHYVPKFHTIVGKPAFWIFPPYRSHMILLDSRPH